MELIVVPPNYYDIKESYNTRMRPDLSYGRPDKKLTYMQWAGLVSTCLGLGIKIHYLNPVQGLDDMAFACDSGLWIGDRFIAGRFDPISRRGEKHCFISWFRDYNRDTRSPVLVREVKSPGARFEGGDCLMVKNALLVGYGEPGSETYQRTNIKGVRELINLLPNRVKPIPVRRITKEFYHLNSVMAYYPSVELLAVYPDAFHPEDILKAEKELRVRVVKLRKEEVYRIHPALNNQYEYSYCLNSIEVNGKVLMPWVSDNHADALIKNGLAPLVPRLGSSEFEKSGGSFRCMTMIHNEL